MSDHDQKSLGRCPEDPARPLSVTLAALAFFLMLIMWSPPIAGQSIEQVDGQRYVDAQGIVSRRLDLQSEDDRRLLASLIMKQEGRVYAFDKAPKDLNGKRRLRDAASPQVFELDKRHDADRLAAAISGGRSMFFVARQTAAAAGAPRLVPESVNHYGGKGQVGRRVDLDNSLDRLRLKAMIFKRKGRVYSFKKGGVVTDEPEIFDFGDSRDADRLSDQISGGRHVFFMVEDAPEKTIPASAKRINDTDRRDDAASAQMAQAEQDKTKETNQAVSGAGGPIQLFPKHSELDKVPAIASSGTTRSDADPAILEFLDEPPVGSAADQATETRRPAAAGNLLASNEVAEQVVAALPSENDVLEEEIKARGEPTPIATPPTPTPARPTGLVPDDPEPTGDEAEVIASLERDRQTGARPVARDKSQSSAKRSGEVVAVDAPKQTHDLAIGEGRLVRLPEPITKLLIADPTVADAQVMSDDLIYIFGNAAGQTNIFGLTADERVLADFDVRVGRNVAGARARLRELQPDTMADFTQVGGQVVAQGLVRDPAEAYQVAALGDSIAGDDQPALNNTVMPGSQQVNIRVRFAEVSRNDIARLGMNWQAILDSGDFLFGLSSGNLFLPDGGGIDPTESFGTVFGEGSFGDFSLDVFLEGLEREGIVNVLAEPNLTAINGRTANFLAGGEIPIPVPQSDDIITIDYKPFGVSLEFLPTLLPGNRINLQVRPEVSSIIDNGGVVLEGFNIPAFTVRRAETAVELASGQTFAIAGLFQRRVVSDIDKFPVVADVPVIGNLFKSPRFQRSETELVILITPYLVQPTPSATLTVPNQRVDRSIPPVEPRQPAAGLGGFIID